MQDYFQVGIITTTHGLKGEVKVLPTTEDMHRFSELVGQQVLLRGPHAEEHFTVEKVRYFKNQVILKFKELQDIDAVTPYRKWSIYVSRAQAIPLGEDEYYVADLIGLKVQDETGRELGVMDDVLTTGANDIYVVKRENQKDLLIPAIRECIVNTDLSDGVMTVHLLPGLEDL